MEQNCAVFSSGEVDDIRRLPRTFQGIESNMKLIIGLLLAIIAICLMPMVIVISQSSKIGGIDVKISYLEKRFEKVSTRTSKKLYWAEKHSREGRLAIEKFIAGLSAKEKSSPPDPLKSSELKLISQE